MDMMTQTTPLTRPSFTSGARSCRPLTPIHTAPLPPLPHEQPEQISALLARAKSCLAKWGDFATRADRMLELSTQSTLSEDEFGYLRRILEATEDRAVKRATQAKCAFYTPAGDSEISDAEVAAGIRLLTRRDADHARNANSEGWSAGDSSTGHWCYAMLSVDAAAAIAVGRTIVGKYKRQLAMGGVI